MVGVGEGVGDGFTEGFGAAGVREGAGGSTSTGASPKAYKPTTCRVCGQKQQTEGRYGQYISAGTKILKNGECVDCYEERKMGY